MKAKVPANSPGNLFDTLRYGINLAWINAERDETGRYVCAGKTREGMDEILKQLKKWCIANPEAEINFWYDSECTNSTAIENTKKYLKELSDSENMSINLRDIREIPFVQENSDLFQSSIPIYFRVDFLKLIISLYLLENQGMDSAIFADLSIGAKVDTVLSKNELYSPDKLETMQQYGMLIGQDTWKPENQFIQTLKTKELILSMKHAINCCLHLATNKLNEAIQRDDPHSIRNLYSAPFFATMVSIYMYILVLHSKEPIKIRADIVNEGKVTQWVIYNPKKHGYVLHGNYLKDSDLGSDFMDINGTHIALNKIIKLPATLNLQPNITQLDGIEESFMDNGKESFMEKVVRTDLNPGKEGSSHDWLGELPHPTQGTEFHCTPWPQEQSELEKETTPEDHFNAVKVDKLIKLCERYKDHLVSESQAKEKYAIVQAILKTLRNPDLDDGTKIEEMKKELTEENKTLLMNRRDSFYGAKFLEGILHILSLGIYSKIDKGTFAFWKSHGEVLVDKLTEESNTINSNK